MEDRGSEEIIRAFNKFIKERRNEIRALQIILEKPYGRRSITLSDVYELVDTASKHPYLLSIRALWSAYREIDNARVRGSDPVEHPTNIISLVSFALGETDLLEPYKDTITKRFNKWLYEQEAEGRLFSDEEKKWLRLMKDHIGCNLLILPQDIERGVFIEEGGVEKAERVFSGRLKEVMEDLNRALSP